MRYVVSSVTTTKKPNFIALGTRAADRTFSATRLRVPDCQREIKTRDSRTSAAAPALPARMARTPEGSCRNYNVGLWHSSGLISIRFPPRLQINPSPSPYTAPHIQQPPPPHEDVRRRKMT